MSARSGVELGLRGVAIAIALAAAIDPAVRSTQASRPLVAVIAGDPARDSAAATQIARALDDRFTVVRSPFPTDATVLVGEEPPRDVPELSSPVFAISGRRAPSVSLERVDAPARAPFDARVPVSATTRVIGARGRMLVLSLRADSLVIDRVTRPIASDDERVSATLGFLPPVPGVASLELDAAVDGTRATDRASMSVDLRDARWSILVYDPRPSWMSTFVKRALERDRRFAVTSRVVTSRNLSTDAGRPPARLDDLDATSHFDALVIGAPDALTDADVAGVEAYLRRRGGSAVLLLDQRTPGPYDRLIGAGAWSTRSLGAGVRIAAAGSDSAVLRASEVAWPNALPAGASALAYALPSPGDSARDHAVLWSSPVGDGRVIVSGALDAWRFRDASQSDFERYWRTVVADAANASPPPMTISISRSAVAPGEEADVTVTVRSAALADLSTTGKSIGATVSAAMTNAASAQHREPLRLVPSGPAGELRGVIRAPAGEGIYRIVASSSGETAEASLVVSRGATRATGSMRDLLAAWVRARGGRVISDAAPQALAAGLVSALRPSSRAEVHHPMRSPWWLLPFALALSAEWWLRRRRGLR